MRKLLAVTLALLGLFLAVNAQTQFGTVSGRVTDSAGGAVPDAKVTLTNTATNTKQEAKTNDEGLYLFANVAPAEYELTVEKANFRKANAKLTVAVAQRVNLDIALEAGAITETVNVQAGGQEIINTTSGEVGRTITEKEITNLPLLTRNPYVLIGLAPGASNTGAVTGDTRGVGYAVAGQRTSSINFMLDGGENNDTFVAGVGQNVPLDAVQEFRVQTNNMTAEFGRNSIVANAITKSGSNGFHGSLWEYYRGSALSTTPFDDNANGTKKSPFVRNQFGASAGGRIKKDKTFFFGSFEGLRIRSSGTARFFVPTTDFVAAASANTNGFLNAFGGIPALPGDLFLTANQILAIEDSPGPLRRQNGTAIPGNTPLFKRVTLSAPIDAGAGAPQNTWLATGRIDHRFSDRTTLLGRYALERGDFFDGTVSLSPFDGFNTGQIVRNHNFNLTLTHSLSATLFSETRFIYNRVLTNQPLGKAPATTPCWQYDFFANTPSGDIITFPGYVPNVCAFAGIPFGGPQNIYQVYEGITWQKGKHAVKAGGQYLHLRDNRTFGAYENAFFDTFDMQGMLDGRVDFIFAAIDPKGKVPGQTYSTATDGPFGFPSFTRHFRYNEVAFYGEDSFKVSSRWTVTAGMRWEYFGVLHSPDNERFLDSNLFLNAVGSATTGSIFQQVANARFQRTNHFYKSDYNNFAPRLGIAWDIFGTGRTVFRGGYGIFYDRNFGNAVFNAIQNPPNYAVISPPIPPTGLPIKPNQFDTLNAAGASLTISSSARMLDANLVTAYSEQWNATLEHDLFGKGIITSVSYLGSNGIKLYSLNNLNQRGSCLLGQRENPAFPCNPIAGNASRLNQTGLTGMNRRGNEGLSRYNGLTFDVRTRTLGNTGLQLGGNYTWSHSIDNVSSFFGDSPFEGNFGFGFRDPYNPALDRANSTNDIRHRMSTSGTWEIPYYRNDKGFAGQVFGGWVLNGIFQAQTGGAFTVYDGSSGSTNQCAASGTNFCFPVIIGSQLPSMTKTPSPDTPNTFTLYGGLNKLFQTQSAFCAGSLLCSARLANLPEFTRLLSPRNLFRTPGYWNLDFSLLKNFNMPWEGHKLQFRAEFFNLPNHSNLFVNVGTNQFTGATSEVTASKGLPPGGGKERRNIQLALRYMW